MNMLQDLELHFLELIRGKKRGLLANIGRAFLYFLSFFYQLIIFFRNWAFDYGILKKYRASVPVISIGNLVVGGTGKTPVTLMMAQEFCSDFMLAILSRGYRSLAENGAASFAVSQGNGPLFPASVCGDEAYLLAQRLPKVHVFVGKNRSQSSKLAEKAGVQIILLDDGMQHRYLERDFEVVVMDATDPFGQGYLLPRGFLREGPSSLARAHLIILNHVNGKAHFELVKRQLKQFTKAPVIGTKMEQIQIEDLKGEPLPSLNGKKVAIFCAIARPEYFLQTIEKMGAEVIDYNFLPDHTKMTEERLIQFCERNRRLGAEWILCTEKDAVKIEGESVKSQPIAWLKTGLVVVEGETDWRSFTKKIKLQALHETTI